jgi:monoamine oxidase
LLGLSSRLRGDRAAIEACVARISLSCAFPADRLSCHAALEGIAETEWQPSHRVLGGNQLIANGLAERLGDRVHTGVAVTAVTNSPDGVRVRCGGADVHADAVVLAVPASLISGIGFVPALPPAKLAALDRLGYGQAAKLHIPLTRSSPVSAVLDVDRGYWCWTANGVGGEPAPVLHCFAGGEPTLEALQVDAGPAGWAATVAELRPDLELSAGQAMLTTWKDDPWAGMAYSASTTRQLPGDAEALAASWERVHFAGEHTAGTWASLMEGALRSGLRAAEEIQQGPGSG